MKIPKIKRTDAQKKRSKALAKVVEKSRKTIRRKRKRETQQLAVVEAARDIISDRKYWVQGKWFDAGTTRPESLQTITSFAGSLEITEVDPSSWYSLEISEQENMASCSVEEQICRVCAEGAIYMAANGTVDASRVISKVNDIIDDLNQKAYREAEKNNEDMWDWDFDYPYGPNIQEINDESVSSAHKNTLAAFDAVIEVMKKEL